MEEAKEYNWSVVARAKLKATRVYEEIGFYATELDEEQAFEIFASMVNHCPPFGLVEHCAENPDKYSIYEVVLMNEHGWHIGTCSWNEKTMKRYVQDYQQQDLVEVDVTLRVTVPSASSAIPDEWDWEDIIGNQMFEVVNLTIDGTEK